jgi:hypothetical protein
MTATNFDDLRLNIPKTLIERDQWVLWWPDKTPASAAWELNCDTNRPWPAATNDPSSWASFDKAVERIEEGWPVAGVGYVFQPKDGIVGLDLDNALSDGGELKPWAAPIVEQLPDTFIEISPSGRGLHAFFYGDLDRARKIRLADGGVELYNAGRYFTMSGKPWKGAPLEIERCPGVIPVVDSLRPARVNGTDPLSESTPVQQGERNNTLASLGGTMRRRGMGYESIHAGLKAENQARCTPPLSDQEVERIAKSVCRYEPTKQEPSESGRPTPLVLTWLSGEGMATMETRKRQNLVDGVVGGEGLTTILADPKGGKSVLCLELCRAVTTGDDFLGRFKVKQGPAIYLQSDDTNKDRFVGNYQDLLETNGGKPFPNFHVAIARVPLVPDGAILLDKKIQETGAKVVVIDCFQSIRGLKTSDWVSQEYDQLRMLSELGTKHKTSVVLIHHLATGKRATAANPFLGAAGSFAVGGSVDGQVCLNLFSFSRTERTVSLQGRDVDAARFIFARGEDKRLFYVCGGEQADLWEEAVRIYRAVGYSGLDGKSVGEACGVSDRHGRAKVARLRAAGIVEDMTDRKFAWNSEFHDLMERVIKINASREEKR